MMRFIGITGGIGAGKSTVLEYLKAHTNCKIVMADDLARALMRPGTALNQSLQREFPKDLFDGEGNLIKEAFVKQVISVEEERKRLNALVHPAVKEEILSRVKAHRKAQDIDYFFLEAALLIEDGYKALCDELWYISVSEENRRKRLKESRGYDDAKIDALFAAQLEEYVFLENCCVVIDNNGSKEATEEQLKRVLELRKPREI